MGQVAPPEIGETRLSDWLTIDQALIDRFAEVTGDDAFIHVDPERAAATQLGGTIAHGFLLLSLAPQLLYTILSPPKGAVSTLNYGIDRLRFVRPVPVGSRVRLAATLNSVDERASDRLRSHFLIRIELDDGGKPALVADWIILYLLQNGEKE